MSFPITKYITSIQYVCIIYTHIYIHREREKDYNLHTKSLTYTKTYVYELLTQHNVIIHTWCPLRCKYGTSMPIYMLYMLSICIFFYFYLLYVFLQHAKIQTSFYYIFKLSITNTDIFFHFWTFSFDLIRFFFLILVQTEIKIWIASLNFYRKLAFFLSWNLFLGI